MGSGKTSEGPRTGPEVSRFALKLAGRGDPVRKMMKVQEKLQFFFFFFKSRESELGCLEFATVRTHRKSWGQ